MLLDLGVFLGSSINDSGDSTEMVGAIYRGVLRELNPSFLNERGSIAMDISSSAVKMWRAGGSCEYWGFKLPESIYLIPYLHQAFPHARYIELIRDPLSTCLRRTHMTARLDNEIGRVTLPSAYVTLGRPIPHIFSDGEGIHMALTTIHQLSLARKSLASIASDRIYTVRFEELIHNPELQLTYLARWLDRPIASNLICTEIDRQRATTDFSFYSKEQTTAINILLRDTRLAHGYIDDRQS
jgi:hypothetical protein